MGGLVLLLLGILLVGTCERKARPQGAAEATVKQGSRPAGVQVRDTTIANVSLSYIAESILPDAFPTERRRILSLPSWLLPLIKLKKGAHIAAEVE